MSRNKKFEAKLRSVGKIKCTHSADSFWTICWLILLSHCDFWRQIQISRICVLTRVYILLRLPGIFSDDSNSYLLYIGSIPWENSEGQKFQEIVPILKPYTYFRRINLFPLTRTHSHVNQRSFKTKLFTGFWTAVNWFLTASDRGETCLTDKVPYWISRFELSILEFSPRWTRVRWNWMVTWGHSRSGTAHFSWQ